MNKFLKCALIIIGMIVSVPITIGLLVALFGFGALVMIIPDVVLGILIILGILMIPGLIVGLIVTHSNDKK